MKPPSSSSLEAALPGLGRGTTATSGKCARSAVVVNFGAAILVAIRCCLVVVLISGALAVTKAFTAVPSATTYPQQQRRRRSQQQHQRQWPSHHPTSFPTITTTTPSSQHHAGASHGALFSLGRVRHTGLLATSSPKEGEGYDDVCDVLVLGSGPAARAIASLLAAKGMDVVLADKNSDREWAPNYGVWKDEWQAVLDRYKESGVDITGGNVGSAVDREWPVTDCYFGGSFDIPTDDRMRLDRPYCRVDKNALRDSFTTKTPSSYRILKANHISTAIGVNMYSPAGSLVHDEDGTTIRLEGADGSASTVRSKLVVDCTGHETTLVLKDTREPYHPPGFQIAYGILADVEGSGVSTNDIGPYDKEAMTLFDYRTDHYDSEGDTAQEKVESAPTFMYAMPLKGNQIFFEETSLVARPAVSFEECKARCYQRLQHLGIEVTTVYEEEFCYIPMGGALPVKDQRVIGLGGASAMVHPSTGYHLCRALMGAADMAKALENELQGQKRPNLDRASASAYHAIWFPDNIRQRNFAVFGGEFLMKQNVVGLRGFFDGFFRLPLEQWGGFLAGWPGLPNNDQHETWWARMLFGINFIIKLPAPVAFDMAANILTYSLGGISLMQSVTPIFGEPPSYEYERNNDRIGDVAAKLEAKRMIGQSKVTAELPVAFGEEEEAVIVGAKVASGLPAAASATSSTAAADGSAASAPAGSSSSTDDAASFQ